MMIPLIKYNVEYYIKSVKYLPPLIFFIAFLAIKFQASPIGIWSNLHITSIAIFILSTWIGVSFVNSEDKTQQYITRLHTKNETVYHFSKIVSIVLFLIPFYVITLLVPVVFGSFARDLLLSEIFVYFAVYFLIGLTGASIGIFFNSDILSGETAILLHLLVTTVVVVPFDTIFADNLFVVYAHYLLPPTNFLAERLHNLNDGMNDGVFTIDRNFLLFAAWSLGYAVILTALYNFIIQRRNKK